ncbi:hypothetical protein WICPIJ_009412 [Wickerhamomyces pijperi]|uniref:Rho-GAP domain-containing protein n=1 Tax=Wickerhamomyces pijperi TaxID=599730 RepID=A0A9P8PNY5_WICPI|nr:hypothetical protein WICPIJ_009412 [Wickerhamomyces pijperi]
MSTSAEQSPTRTQGGLSSWWKPFKKSQNSNEQFAESPNVRPFNLKSRSFTSSRPSLSEEEIRQQRDQFISSNKPFELGNQIFGVPLQESIAMADSLISVPSDDPNDFIRYGKIPLIIGKCGSHLKEKGINKEGIFRVAGSSRRVKELQYIFSTSPDFGRKMSWDGYTVHDAASIFRRYLNNLPEPLVPLDLYDAFREPVSSRPRIISHIQARNDTIEKRLKMIQKQRQVAASGGDPNEIQSSPGTDDDDEMGLTPEEIEKKRQADAKKQKRIAKEIRYALKDYRRLIDGLPTSNKHLLYYLLDMLNMFAEQAKDNLMPARNLAAIFQPSILSHPNHDLNPEEYALSQAVVELLIEYSKRILPDIKNDTRKEHRNSTDSKVPISSFNIPQITTTAADAKLETPSTTSTETDLESKAKAPIDHNTVPKVTSNVNLKVYRNNSSRSRPHSRSLSTDGGVPDHIKRIPLFGSNNQNHTDQEDSSDEEEYTQARDESSLITPSNPPNINFGTTDDNNSISNSGTTPTKELSKLDIVSPSTNPTSTSMLSPLAKVSTSIDDNTIDAMTTVPKDRKRPVSMFPTGGSYNTSAPLDIEKEERHSRWFDSDRGEGQELGLSPPVKKENWFNRLRSSSRGKKS